MNRLDISATGFPETTKTWIYTQAILAEGFLALAKLAGENVIISGVQLDDPDTPTTVTDGFIIYNDEILKFEGGAYNDIVSVIETTEQVSYNTDANDDTILDILPAYTTRTAKCGTGLTDTAASFDFMDLKSLKTLYELSNFEVNQATEEDSGIAEIATQTEANSDTDDERMITAKKLSNRSATTSRRGVVELTTGAEVSTGTDNKRAITVSALRSAGYRITKVTKGTLACTYGVAYTYPPTGYNMSNLVGFMPSIATIHFDGNVDNNDSLYCVYNQESTRIKITCKNTEQRAQSKVNYLAIWQK